MDNKQFLNYQAARKVVLDQISQIQYPDSHIEYWYNIAQKFVLTNKQGRSITREEALRSAALQFQILHGDSNDIIHRLGFLDEKSKSNYIHPNFRKDLTFEQDLYKEHAKLVGMTPMEAKRKYTELARILKRTVENIFPCYIYSADKIEAKEVMVVVGESVVILDGNDQTVYEQFLASSIITCYDQHTAQNERERLRKQLGHVSNLHQLVLDIGKPTMLRILSSDRANLRKRLQDHVTQAKELEEYEKAEKEKTAKTEQTLKSTVIVPSNPLELEQIKCWFLNSKNSEIFFKNSENSESSENVTKNQEVIEVIVWVQNKNIVIIHATTEEMLNEIQFDWIKGWRYEPLSEEVRAKLTEKIQDSASTYLQLYLDLGNLQPSLRLLTSDRKLQEILRALNTEPTFVLKEGYYGHFLTRPDPFTPLHEGTPKAVIVRMHLDQIQFRSALTGAPVLELPVKCIHSVDIQPIPEDQKGKYEKGYENFLVLNVSHWHDPVLLATDEVHPIVEKIKKLMSLTEDFKKTFLPKIERDLTVRGKLFNGFTTTKNLLVQVKEDQVVITETDEATLHRVVPLGDIEGWALVVKASDTDQPLTVSSTEPQTRDISQLLQDLVGILLPKPVEANSPTVTKTENDTGLDIKNIKTTGSGSDIDLGDIDTSNSGEK